MRMRVDGAALLELLTRLDGALSGHYVLVAAGGTALTLHNLKTSTKDVGFIVDSGDADEFGQLANGLSDVHVGVFERGKVWFNPLPADYVSAAVRYGSFANMELFALSIPDIIITKAARLSGDDWGDIISCRESATWTELARRFTAYSKNSAIQLNNMRKVLINVFGAAPEDLVNVA